MNRKTIIYTALALTLTACSSDDAPKGSAIQEIQLFTQVSGSATRAADDADALQDAQLAGGTTISVKVKENVASPTVDYALALYTADGSGGLSLPAGQKQYYPASGNGVNIYAFHPAGAPSAFEVQADQTTADGYRKSDLMYASLTNVTSASTAAQRTLSFSHLLSKVVVTLVAGAGCSADDLASATVTLGNGDLVTSGTFTAATGSFTPATSGTGTITLAENAGTASHTAIVVPQAVSGRKINVTMNSITRSYTITTPPFAAGTKYAYTLQVGFSGIVLVSTQINAWDDDEGNVTSPESPLVI